MTDTNKVQKTIEWNKATRVAAINRLKLPRGQGVSAPFLKALLSKLEDSQGSNPCCWISQEKLAEYLGASERQVRTGLNWLAVNELIQRERRFWAGSTRNTYAILFGNVCEYKAPSNRQFETEQPAISARATGNLRQSNRQFPPEQPAISESDYKEEPSKEPSSTSRVDDDGFLSLSEFEQAKQLDYEASCFGDILKPKTANDRRLLRQWIKAAHVGQLDRDAFFAYVNDVREKFKHGKVTNRIAYLRTCLNREMESVSNA